MNKLAALAAVLLLSASARAAQPLKVNMIDSGFPAELFAYAGKTGAFEKAGTAVEATPVSRFILPAVIAGKADAAVISLAPVLEAYQHGADVKVLAVLWPRFDHFAVSRYKPEDAAKIKTVAYNSHGAASRLLLRPFLEKLKVDADKVASVAAAGDAARFALLERGEADVAAFGSPELRRRVETEGKLYVLSAEDVGPGEPVVLATSGRTLAARGAALDALVAGLRASLEELASDPRKLRDFLTKERGAPEAQAAAEAKAFAASARVLDYVPSRAAVDRTLAAMGGGAPKGGRSWDGLLAADAARRAVSAPRKGPAAR